MMADFQNAFISRIFSVFASRFSHRTALNELQNRMDFDMFFGISLFVLQQGFCMGYSLFMMADFQNGLNSRIFGVFPCVFLHRKTLNDF